MEKPTASSGFYLQQCGRIRRTSLSKPPLVTLKHIKTEKSKMRLECQKLIELHKQGAASEESLIRKIERSYGYMRFDDMIWDDLKKASAERFKRMLENSSLTEIERQIVELINLHCWIDLRMAEFAKEKWGM